MIIIERAKGQRNIEGSETTVDVEIPVIFADTTHSRFRQDTREITKEQAIELVKQKLPEIMNTLTSGKLVRNEADDFVFCVVDKQTCAVVGCTMKTSSTLAQKVVIRTVYFFDQYHTMQTKGNVFYVNEDNPSKEWEDAIYYSDLYKNVYSGYRRYEKELDPEHPEVGPYADKSHQEASMWYNYGINQDDYENDMDRIGKDYTLAKDEANRQNNDHKMKNHMGYPVYSLDKANDAADNRILTKRGPNGTLRGIDRRRKAAERKLNKIVKEEIKLYYESI